MKSAACALLLAAMTVGAAKAQTPSPPMDDQVLGRAILQQLVEIDSTHARGSTGVARAIAARLIAAGFPSADVQFVAPPDHPTKGNVVVRVHGADHSAKPLLYICHLDVVEARREDWTYDPFKLTENDGWLYGRGTIDMKGQDSSVLETLLRLHRENWTPRRDVIVAFTADEEAGGDASGIDYLIKARRPLIDAGLVINPDSGGGGSIQGRKLFLGIQTAEKVFETYQIEATDKGGHSSEPTPANPIYRIARALGRIDSTPFPVHFTTTSRAYFAARAALTDGQAKADLADAATGSPSQDAPARLSSQVETNVMLRTTCVATQIEGGQGESALPERARATLQCRVIPGEPADQVQHLLTAAIDDPMVKLTTFTAAIESPESPPSPEVSRAVEAVAHQMWPDVRIVPFMSAGASDSMFTRTAGMPSYGIDGIFGDIDDERAHGRDERVKINAFNEELEFTYRLMKALGSDS